MKKYELTNFKLLFNNVIKINFRGKLIDFNKFIQSDENIKLYMQEKTLRKQIIFVLKKADDIEDIDIDLIIKLDKNKVIQSNNIEYLSYFVLTEGINDIIKPNYTINTSVKLNSVNNYITNNGFDISFYPTVILTISLEKIDVRLWVCCKKSKEKEKNEPISV